MDEPTIRFATGADGTPLPYMRMGSGQRLPLYYRAAFPLRGILRLPHALRFFTALAEERRVVMTQMRGTSHGEFADEWEHCATDVSVVAAAVGFDRFALMSEYRDVPIGVRLAAELGGRIVRLALWGGLANQTTLAHGKRVTATQQLRTADWDLYIDALGLVLVGRTAPSALACEVADVIRADFTPDAMAALVEATSRWDGTPCVPEVTAPVLVVHRRDASIPETREVEALVASLPNAALRLLEGDAVYPALGDPEEAGEVINEFLAETESAATPASVASLADVSNPDGLSRRELEVLAEVASGKPNREVAEALVISPATVTRHISNIPGKTGCSNRTELANYATAHGLGSGPRR